MTLIGVLASLAVTCSMHLVREGQSPGMIGVEVGNESIPT
jgi:hypothetical protein